MAGSTPPPNNVADQQNAQSQQLQQQFAAEEQRRNQQKGNIKPVLDNLFLVTFKDYDITDTFAGKFSQAANLIPLSTLPGIAHSLKVRTSLWREGTFTANNDILSFLDKMKQSQTKEDAATAEKQKFDRDQQSNHEAHNTKMRGNEQHASQPSNESQQYASQPQRDNNRSAQQDNDDSHKNYWAGVNMSANQMRMNITNKNAENFEALQHYLHEQSRILDSYKHQAQIIENNRPKQRG